MLSYLLRDCYHYAILFCCTIWDLVIVLGFGYCIIVFVDVKRADIVFKIC